MPSNLRRLPETVTLTCSQYALELQPEDREAFARDPVHVIGRLIAEAGAPAPNAIIIDDVARQAMLEAGDGGTTPPVVVHVDSPPSHASRYIIFVM